MAFGDYGSGNPSRARKIVKRYPVGFEVTVCYDPKEPETCVLEPGVKGQTWFLPLFGSIFCTVGTIMLWALPKAMRQQG